MDVLRVECGPSKRTTPELKAIGNKGGSCGGTANSEIRTGSRRGWHKFAPDPSRRILLDHARNLKFCVERWVRRDERAAMKLLNSLVTG